MGTVGFSKRVFMGVEARVFEAEGRKPIVDDRWFVL
jgi:hypothetical protein